MVKAWCSAIVFPVSFSMCGSHIQSWIAAQSRFPTSAENLRTSATY